MVDKEVGTVARAPITLLIAVAVRLYRDGLAESLSARGHLRIARTTATPLETQVAVRDLQPDLVIVDVSLKDALSLIRTLRLQNATTRILAFAVGEEISSILSCAEAGADGFVTVNDSLGELVEAIERTVAGELLCSPRIAAQLLRRAARQASSPVLHAAGRGLTRREAQVFGLLKQGRSNKEIANALNIAEATVKNHVHNLLEKLHVATRGQAIAAIGPLSGAAL